MNDETKDAIVAYVHTMPKGKTFYTPSLCYYLRRDIAIEVSPYALRHILPDIDCLKPVRTGHRAQWKVI